jgi:predicted RNA-binding protein with TRAM domain
MGKYEPDHHDNEPILCPREKCRRKNAPMESDEFSPRCWDCNTFLNVTPVSNGDEVLVNIEDIHQNGSGVGKTEDGYVVLVEGVLPPARAKVEITNVKPNYAEGEILERLEQEDDNDEDDQESEDDEDPSLGSRDNHWG